MNFRMKKEGGKNDLLLPDVFSHDINHQYHQTSQLIQ